MPKYKAKPSVQERAFHIWLIENNDCFCGCGRWATLVHHPLSEHPKQGTRRNHQFVVPMFHECHTDLHAAGSEAAFDPGKDYAEGAYRMRQRGINAGFLSE